MPINDAKPLAKRLRQLRVDEGLTQPAVGNAMKPTASVALISSWENAKDVPPIERVKAYAKLFARTAWSAADNGELSNEEQLRQASLEEELLSLRSVALGETPGAPAPASNPMATGPWHFADGGDITIVCAPLSRKLLAKMPYADPSDPDFVKLYTYADVDSLVELHGHIRAANPASEVRFKLANELVEDDYTTHLVLLGGVDWNAATRRMLKALKLPIRQVSRQDETDDRGWFEVSKGGQVSQIEPQVEVDATDHGTLLEDVGQFVRGPNPLREERTVTICNGMYGQGTYGSVRALTDKRFRDRNAKYIADHFTERDTYCLLFRVGIFESIALTPDWNKRGTVLDVWSEAAE